MRASPISAFPLAALLAVLAFMGCGAEKPDTGPGPRPVTIIELREIDPVKSLQRTGAIKSWKEQNISVEVDGRVEMIVEQPGTPTEEVEELITAPLEEVINTLDGVRWVRSETSTGRSAIYVELDRPTPGDRVDQMWDKVRSPLGQKA